MTRPILPIPCDLAVSSERVVMLEGERPGTVLIKDGRFLGVAERGARPRGAKRIDVGAAALLPGLVDTHVHLNEPGRAEWEGFATGSAAAVAGGTTTLVDMPLNCIPVTTTRRALDLKKRAAKGRFRTDYAFWGGVVPGNEGELEGMAEAGALGFKCFLVHSGIDEFPNVTAKDLRKHMRVLAKLGLPLLVHAELDCGHGPLAGTIRSYGRYLASRPRAWEVSAIEMMARLSAASGCRVHIVHLSASDALPVIERARFDGAPLTVETCPHYLGFAAEDIPDGRTDFKCAPPIRERENADKLWKGLRDGLIDMVVSDHSPCAPQLKRLAEGDFERAWGGISSVQFALPAVWTQARKRGFTLRDVALWMSTNPARFAKLDGMKGRIALGLDADLTVFDADKEWTPAPHDVLHRHKTTPYVGRKLRGRVTRVFRGGVEIYRTGRQTPPTGRFLTRRPSPLL